MTLRVAGSLWSVPPENVAAEACRLVEAGLTTWHWDRADGTLGTAGGFSASAARSIADATGVASEAHLMLADPRPEIPAWTAFAELVVVHVESPHWRESVDRIQDSGSRAGLAIAPGTAIPPDLDHDLAILIMTVAPGNAGSSFLAPRLSLLDDARLQPLRGVDGGLTLDRGREARARGANWLVSGTALTSADDPRSWLAALRTP